MKNVFLTLLLIVGAGNILSAGDSNKNPSQKHIEEQIAKEKQYAKEKTFYHGKDYNLSATQIDEDTVNSVPLIKPEDDFDMTDVYRDDI